MRFQTLDAWLDWQQTLNPKKIDLGLQRVKSVYNRLGIDRIADRIITVCGTNGKGSTVAYYESWLNNSGFKVASYTSPHVLQYNERIKLHLQNVCDDQLCQVFNIVDQAREQVPLTYFEFGTLAAFYLMAQYKPDVAILEVGLGGRLDAVNILDADLAHVTPIGLDHQDWLGDTREEIAREKAGILRANGLAVCNDSNPPASLLGELDNHRCEYIVSKRDYDYRWLDDSSIEWWSGDHKLIVRPPLVGNHQAHNLSGVLAGLSLLGYLEGIKQTDITERFSGIQCPGRLQKIDSNLAGQLWVDVGHNVDAARVLALFLQKLDRPGRIIVLLGMLSDKNAEDFVLALKSMVDEWWLLGLDGERGLSAQQLATRISAQLQPSQLFDTADQALEHAVLSLKNQDILLTTGSFMTVESLLSSSYLKSEH